MEQTKGTIYTPLRWGRSPLTADDEVSSFLAVGAAGSGKSLVLRCLMQSLLCQVGEGKGIHGLVYDPKNDAMSVLSAFVDPSHIKLFNPLDTRCVCWDTAKDIRSPLECNQLAWALVPRFDQDSFFERAVRSIIRHTAMSFNLSKLPWTFADLLRALRDKETYAKVLLRHPQTAHIVRRFLNDAKLSSDIDATLESICGEFEPLAACFEQATEKVAIKDCIERESVVVLGNYETCRESIQRLNLVLSSIYTHRVLSLPDYTEKRYWQFYDEISEAGPLKHLSSFAKLGRSKGGRLVLAFQSLAGLQHSRLFGREGTEDMLSNFGNRFVGRVEDPTTAKWLSDYIGEQDIEQVSRTTSFGKNGSSSETRSKHNQRTLLPSEFMSIPHAGRTSGLTGLFKLRSTVAYWDHIDGGKLFDQLLMPKAEGVEGFIEREVDDQYLLPWTVAQEHVFAPAIGQTPKQNLKVSQRHDPTDEDQIDIDNDAAPDIDLTDFRS